MEFYIIGLSGPAGSGKDAVADALCANHGFVRMALADPLKEMASIMTGYSVDTVNAIKDGKFRIGTPDAHVKMRRVLQKLGTEVGRDTWDDRVWIDNLLARINRKMNYVSAHPSQGIRGIVITDVRFLNEVQAIRNHIFIGYDGPVFTRMVHLNTNKEWMRCPPPKWLSINRNKWWARLYNRLMFKWALNRSGFFFRLTKNPYFHPSEVEPRLARKHGWFDIERWNGGHMNKTPEDLGRGPAVRVYDSTPEELARAIIRDVTDDFRVYDNRE